MEILIYWWIADSNRRTFWKSTTCSLWSVIRCRPSPYEWTPMTISAIEVMLTSTGLELDSDIVLPTAMWMLSAMLIICSPVSMQRKWSGQLWLREIGCITKPTIINKSSIPTATCFKCLEVSRRIVAIKANVVNTATIVMTSASWFSFRKISSSSGVIRPSVADIG